MATLPVNHTVQHISLHVNSHYVYSQIFIVGKGEGERSEVWREQEI